MSNYEERFNPGNAFADRSLSPREARVPMALDPAMPSSAQPTESNKVKAIEPIVVATIKEHSFMIARLTERIRSITQRLEL